MRACQHGCGTAAAVRATATVGNWPLDHQSRPSHFGRFLIFSSHRFSLHPLGYSAHRGAPPSIPSRSGHREPLQPWETLPAAVPAFPLPNRYPSTRFFAPAPSSLVIRPSSQSLDPYLTLQASFQSSQLVPVAWIACDSPRPISRAWGQLASQVGPLPSRPLRFL